MVKGAKGIVRARIALQNQAHTIIPPKMAIINLPDTAIITPKMRIDNLQILKAALFDKQFH